MSQSSTHWLPSSATTKHPVDCLCLGTGRFLRAVLVPLLNASELHPVLVQARGRNFLEYMIREDKNSFPVDTVLESGEIQTDMEMCYGAFSWGRDQDRDAFYDWLEDHSDQVNASLRVIGLGVTEAGLASAETTVMKHLYHLLQTLCVMRHQQTDDDSSKICILSTDNVPQNGQLIQRYMEQLAGGDSSMKSFLKNKVVFLNSMVDRITSERPGSDGLVPQTEPLPAKALVLLDKHNNLPTKMREMNGKLGLVLRQTDNELDTDIALKLRVANGTHTAIAHALALQLHTMTDVLARTEGAVYLQYVDAIFEDQILPASLVSLHTTEPSTRAVYEDWRRRLTHPEFGLSSFFITQNGATKGGIRLGPTVKDLIQGVHPITVTTAFAFATLLRWLTPTAQAESNGVYRGWFPKYKEDVSMFGRTVEYADQLRYNVAESWYEFRCSDQGLCGKLLLRCAKTQKKADVDKAVRDYLLSEDGGKLGAVEGQAGFETFAQTVAILFAKQLGGESPADQLEAIMIHEQSPYSEGAKTDCNDLVSRA